MGKAAYRTGRLYAKKALIVEQANSVLDEWHEEDRLPVTLRALWYQFVARGWLSNNAKEQGKYYGAMSDGRNLGLIDWDAIYEEGRRVQSFQSFEQPRDAIDPWLFQVDLWNGQAYRPEVWVEKAAQLGTLDRVCSRYRVPYVAMEGWPSTGAFRAAGERMLSYRESGQEPVVFYLGDLDPTGLRMDQTWREKLHLYTRGAPPTFTRIALTLRQVEEGELPPNVAKEKDVNFGWFKTETGQEDLPDGDVKSWEMDALSPAVLEDLIQDSLQSVITDADAWQRQESIEAEGRRRLIAVRDDPRLLL